MSEKKEESNHLENVLNIWDKISRSFNSIEKTSPSIGFGIKFNEDKQFCIYCSSYENHLQDPDRKNNALKEASANVDGLLKKLKENLKKDFDETLKAKIVAESSDVECISLNGRFKLTFKKLYEMDQKEGKE
jgi:hypothetical protein